MAPIFFWREFETPHGYLSQWYECPFTVDGTKYWHTEMWMMTQKAKLFGDEQAVQDIKMSKEPRKHKAIGRRIKGFDSGVWDQHKSRIVEEGNYHKFTKTPAKDGLKQLLLDTGDRELVEASPFDRIWGVGFKAEDAPAMREVWGENLLGQAIMRARDRIRREDEEAKKQG
ncbi:Hypothetical protein D9617_15g043110 [Elsinoe fawcettii]|nr:Hypothetical protein D9617_15g043110 [Elsinoe fawcettii]